jgi:hypothetical protein
MLDKMRLKLQSLTFTVVVAPTSTNLGASGRSTFSSLKRTRLSMTKMNRIICTCPTELSKTASAKSRVMSINMPASFILSSRIDSFRT